MLLTESPRTLPAPAPQSFQATAFGHTWLSDLPLPPFTPGASSSPAPFPPITIRTTHAPPPPQDFIRTRRNVHFAPNLFRYTAAPHGTIDAHHGNLIHIYPGPAFTGTPPPPLFSTITALLLAFRGFLPMHGSAVVQDGQVTLICGEAGMGKSTTAAQLIARGALLLSDDLSVLQANRAGGPPVLYAGRRSIRLHPDSAAALARAVPCHIPPHPADGKVAVYPPQADPHRPYPLARIILLGHPAHIPSAQVAPLLNKHFFRPECLRLMDNHDRRIALIAIASRFLEITGAPPYDPHH